MQTFNGKSFLVAKGTTHPDYSYFTFEQEERDFRDKYWQVKSNDVVFDIGASYGTYTLSAGAMDAKVYTFEPEKTIYCDLVQNITLNGWQDRCYPFNIGLWSSETSVDMKSYAPHWPGYCISGDYQVKTVDKIVKENKITKLDWMKIDVEGAEEHVIRGAINTISKLKPKLIIECHIFLSADIKDNVKEIISSISNYDFEEISRPPCVMLYCTPKKD